MTVPKILVLGEGEYLTPFLPRGSVKPLRFQQAAQLRGEELDEILKASDIIVFTGGNDVAPSVYGMKYHPRTSSNLFRDKIETKIFEFAKENNKGMVGICRGAQFLNVSNGGKLFQHVSSHAVGQHHYITIPNRKNKSISVNSTHHQMMIPGKGAKLLAYAEERSFTYQLDSFEESRVYARKILGRTKEGRIKEPEVIWYNKTKSLCVQYHPERMLPSSEGYEYFDELLDQYIM